MFRSFIKWWFRGRGSSHSTRLLGNAGLPSYENTSSIFSKHSSFERAAFGKYDTPFFRRTWVRIVMMLIIVSLIVTLTLEIINGLGIFE